MKNYIKPAVSFQFFNVVDGVSAGCNMDKTNAPYDCPVEIPNWPGETLFNASNCMWTPNDGDFDICYQGPSGVVSVIGS
jgi:hypothetical protein